MSSSSETTDSGPPPRAGWFDDPTIPGQDRWWNGYQWTEHTAKSPRPSIYGPGYARSMRTGMNTQARIARWAATAAAILMVAEIAVVFITVPLLADSGSLPAPIVRTLLIALPMFALLFGLTAIVLGATGLARSSRYGALGGSIHSIVSGGVFAIASAAFLLLFYTAP